MIFRSTSPGNVTMGGDYILGFLDAIAYLKSASLSTQSREEVSLGILKNRLSEEMNYIGDTKSMFRKCLPTLRCGLSASILQNRARLG